MVTLLNPSTASQKIGTFLRYFITKNLLQNHQKMNRDFYRPIYLPTLYVDTKSQYNASAKNGYDVITYYVDA